MCNRVELMGQVGEASWAEREGELCRERKERRKRSAGLDGERKERKGLGLNFSSNFCKLCFIKIHSKTNVAA